MRLSSQPYYTLSADNLVINTIKASNNGRIFMGAKDGCLYEFYYQVLNIETPLMTSLKYFLN